MLSSQEDTTLSFFRSSFPIDNTSRTVMPNLSPPMSMPTGERALGFPVQSPLMSMPTGEKPLAGTPYHPTQRQSPPFASPLQITAFSTSHSGTGEDIGSAAWTQQQSAQQRPYGTTTSASVQNGTVLQSTTFVAQQDDHAGHAMQHMAPRVGSQQEQPSDRTLAPRPYSGVTMNCVGVATTSTQQGTYDARAGAPPRMPPAMLEQPALPHGSAQQLSANTPAFTPGAQWGGAATSTSTPATTTPVYPQEQVVVSGAVAYTQHNNTADRSNIHAPQYRAPQHQHVTDAAIGGAAAPSATPPTTVWTDVRWIATPVSHHMQHQQQQQLQQCIGYAHQHPAPPHGTEATSVPPPFHAPVVRAFRRMVRQ